MPLIPEPILDDIQARIDIAELIGRHIPLQRAGRHFKAVCPFHQERTPSFHVNTDKQIFHCFGCGVGGNVFSFLMQQERLTFPEAVRRLAQEAGVTLPDAPDGQDQSEALYEVLDKACRYFERVLAHADQGKDARAYLLERGIQDKARQTFRLGRAGNGWDSLLQASRKSSVPPDVLAQAGLTLQGPRGTIDRFRQRLMFPIEDPRGRVVGFGGRSLAGQEPKYLNSPETPVYHKGRQLYGLVKAKDAIIKTKTAIVVEGYFDCIALWQAGFENVVSPSGTAFTPEQARALARYAERVVLAFDGDAAGQAASLRGIDVLLEAGFHVRIVQLPGNVDPDELVQRSGAAALQQVLDGAANVMDFLVTCAKRQYRTREAEGKARAAQAILPTIAKVPDLVLRSEYLRHLAGALQLDERAVLSELQRTRAGGKQGRQALPAARRPEPGSGAERLLVGLILDQPSRWEGTRDGQLLGAIRDERLRRLVSAVSELAEAGVAEPTPAQLISRVVAEGLGALASEVVALAQSVASKDKAYQECANRLRADAKKRYLSALRDRIQAAEASGHSEELSRLLEAYQRILNGTDDPSRPASTGASSESEAAVMEERAWPS